MVIISESVNAAMRRIIFFWFAQNLKVAGIGALSMNIIDYFSHVQNSNFCLSAQCQFWAEDFANFLDFILLIGKLEKFQPIDWQIFICLAGPECCTGDLAIFFTMNCGAISRNMILIRYRVAFHCEDHESTPWGCIVSIKESTEASPDILMVFSGCIGSGEKITKWASPVGRNTTAKCRLGTVRHCARIFFDGDKTTSGYFRFIADCRKPTKFLNDSGKIATSSGHSSLEASNRNLRRLASCRAKFIFNWFRTCKIISKTFSSSFRSSSSLSIG